MKPRSKYNSKKIEIDNFKFDSADESKYYLYLKDKKERGEVLYFLLQPKYILIPKFVYFEEKRRELTYTADFLVYYPDGTFEAIDIKGFSSQQGDIRRKLFEYKFPNEKLTWITRNFKHGDKDGWIGTDELKKIRAKNKREAQ